MIEKKENTEEVLITDVDISLFEPSKDDYKLEYPELAEIEEFKDLSDRELKFCWYIGNRTSSIRRLKKQERVSRAVEIAFGKAGQKKPAIQALAKGKIPDKLMDGIERMSKFNPSVRLRAKLNVEYIFDQLQDVINISEDDKASLDPDELKKYCDMIIKTAHEMPQMVKIMETGFGIKVKRKTRDEKVEIKASIGQK